MSLEGRTVAVLAAGGYQELELWYPVLRAREEGAGVVIVSSDPDGVDSNLGYPLLPDGEADPAALDALVVAGTVTGEPAYSAAQSALIRAAFEGTARVYSVGNSAAAVRRSLGAERHERWVAFESADDLPELFGRLYRDLSEEGLS
ncbi:DJ-1/PfpI family protein [Nonomuraea sp. M3C6]|uniref:DJ-1/PfpI family protein n=1 Tax=Nonomuraea marmarensis TaxID=3351344 RepID=A0ABW7AIJ0_9ACTN